MSPKNGSIVRSDTMLENSNLRLQQRQAEIHGEEAREGDVRAGTVPHTTNAIRLKRSVSQRTDNRHTELPK